MFTALLTLIACAAPTEVIVPDGDSHDGHAIVTPLPVHMRLENKSGMGLGLCVFTSINNAALWQDVKQLQGFRDWMTKRKGGGWPEKVDSMIAEYCKEQGVSAPVYVQHTGGDVAFLEKALRTGRMPSVTYDGRDGVHYRGPIAHMVNLVYLDSQSAAILDNNYPKEILWMSRAEFLDRWKGSGGGWAVVLTDSPPPPRKRGKMDFPQIEQCPGGNCPLPYNRQISTYKWKESEDSHNLYLDSTLVGTYFTKTGRYFRWDGDRGIEEQPPVSLPVEKQPAGEEAWRTHGVSLPIIKEGYICNGKACSRQAAYDALGGSLDDDSGKGYLTVIGDDSFRKAVLAAFSSPVLAKVKAGCHIRAYSPDAWQVRDFGLSKGIVLQGPRQADGTADVLKTLPDFSTPEKLAASLSDEQAAPQPSIPPYVYFLGIGGVLLLANCKRSK